MHVFYVSQMWQIAKSDWSMRQITNIWLVNEADNYYLIGQWGLLIDTCGLANYQLKKNINKK